MATFRSPLSTPSTPAAQFERLQEEAAHKAALKMFYSAADLMRDYHGPFAAETKAQREQQARDYEMQGAAAEKERKEHGPDVHSATSHEAYRPLGSHPSGSHPTADKHPHSVHWQCPSCHAMLPQPLVVCGHCGLDFRTGEHYSGSPVKPAARQITIRYTKTPAMHHHRHGKKRKETSPAAVVFTIIGVIAFVLGVMSVSHKLMSSVTSAGRPATSSTLPR